MRTREITLHPATPADLPVVKNLVPYYIYDMSEHTGWPCSADGRFDGCNGIERFWTQPRRHAFVIRSGKEWAGFALVDGRHGGKDGVDYSIAEFFVLRKFRGRGVGGRVARQLFDRFRGRWKVEQLAANKPAVAFWRKVVGEYCDGNFTQRRGKSRFGPLNVLWFDNSALKRQRRARRGRSHR